MPRPLLILGAGCFAEEIADLAAGGCGLQIIGFAESLDRARCGRQLRGHPVYWVDEIRALSARADGLGAIASPQRREFIGQAAGLGLRFITLVHPKAHVPQSASIGSGVTVSPGVITGAYAEIGEHVILGRGALIGHHTRIGAFSTIGPGANIAGRTTVGEGCHIAMGAIVVDGVSVGDGAFIGAGSVVTSDVPPGGRVLGRPARTMRQPGE